MVESEHEAVLADRLDGWRQALLEGPTREAVSDIFSGLERMRRRLSDTHWRALVHRLVHPHPIVPLLHECPYSRRAYLKPRGYAGDATLLDYLYFGTHPAYVHDRAVTPLGRTIFSETVGCGAGEAVRERRRRIADAIDAVSAEAAPARVLSIASGFAREAALCKSLLQGRLRLWTCLDQDAESVRGLLALAESRPEIRPLRASIRALLSDELDAGGPYDLCYAAGLLDYLDESVARLLLGRMFELLSPGGRLLVANFASETAERAFMEAIGDWWLHYRTQDQMWSLASVLPDRSVRSVEIYHDDTGRMIYLDVRRD